MLLLWLWAMAQHSNAQCLQALDSPVAADWAVVEFPSAARGLILSADGQAWRTADGGNSWSPADLHSREAMQAVGFSGEQNGWAVGEAGTIRSTADGGASWGQQFSPLGADWRAVDFVNSELGLVAGGCGGLMRTADGGQRWSWVDAGSTNTLHALAWVNASVALSAGEGGLLLRSDDGGQNWGAIAGTGSGNHYSLAVQGDTAWLSGEGGTYFSADNGQSWSLRSSAVFTDLEAVRPGALMGCSPQGALLYSSNGGQSWQSLAAGLRSLDFFSSSQGIAVGDDGQLWRITWPAAPELAAPGQACRGDTLQLLGSAAEGPASYQWAAPDGSTVLGNSASFVLSESGTFTYEVTQNGCSLEQSVFIEALPPPELELGPGQSFCEGQSALLSAGVEAATYNWSDGSATPSISVATPGEYSLTVVDEAGCSAADTVTVAVLPRAIYRIEQELCSGETLTVGNSTFDVSNPSGTVVFPGGAANGCDSLVEVSLSFITPEPVAVDTALCAGELPLDYLGNSIEAAGTYSFELEGPAGCPQPHFVSLEVREEVRTESSASICEGGTLVWNGDTLSQAGIYESTFTSANGCDSTAALQLSLWPKPTIAIVDTLPDDGSGSGRIELSATDGTPPYEYRWESGAAGAVLENLEAGIYRLTLTDANGCRDSLSIELRLLNAVADLGKQAAFAVWPNPSEGAFTLEIEPALLPTARWLRMYGYSGQFLAEWRVGGERQVLQTHQPAGAYWLELVGERGVLGRRILIVQP